MPRIKTSYFETFTGIALGGDEEERVQVMLDRARRAIDAQITVPAVLQGDDLLDYSDAVAETAWMYWEAEKGGAMEILAMPITQLSLGTLFWTKDRNGPPRLPTLERILGKWGNVRGKKISLEGELDYR